MVQYNVDTPAEYLAELEDDWRRCTLKALRHLILSSGDGLEEGIHYKMLCYSNQYGNVFHLNAQKHYVSLYVGNADRVDPEGKLLLGLDVGKGCIRFKKSVDVADTRINEFIEKSIELADQGVDLNC